MTFLQLHLNPASGNILTASGKESITQNMRLTNSQHGKKSLVMRIKVSYKINGKETVEVGQINNFPQGNIFRVLISPFHCPCLSVWLFSSFFPIADPILFVLLFAFVAGESEESSLVVLSDLFDLVWLSPPFGSKWQLTVRHSFSTNYISTLTKELTQEQRSMICGTPFGSFVEVWLCEKLIPPQGEIHKSPRILHLMNVHLGDNIVKQAMESGVVVDEFDVGGSKDFKDDEPTMESKADKSASAKNVMQTLVRQQKLVAELKMKVVELDKEVAFENVAREDPWFSPGGFSPEGISSRTMSTSAAAFQTFVRRIVFWGWIADLKDPKFVGGRCYVERKWLDKILGELHPSQGTQFLYTGHHWVKSSLVGIIGEAFDDFWLRMCVGEGLMLGDSGGMKCWVNCSENACGHHWVKSSLVGIIGEVFGDFWLRMCVGEGLMLGDSGGMNPSQDTQFLYTGHHWVKSSLVGIIGEEGLMLGDSGGMKKSFTGHPVFVHMAPLWQIFTCGHNCSFWGPSIPCRKVVNDYANEFGILYKKSFTGHPGHHWVKSSLVGIIGEEGLMLGDSGGMNPSQGTQFLYTGHHWVKSSLVGIIGEEGLMLGDSGGMKS
ncbi:hypothetical protein V8G54_001823 [Vigna mungo]|uniref:GAE domain-containing protein n=1 Tax=Vigna mungo TaxID=3915 RepID=A0AAQ3P8I2_VIGMU